nr:hypothetical protein FTX54_02245 [Alkalicoccus halolimnae]
MNMKRKVTGLLLISAAGLAACSNEDPADPEDTLDAYLESWNSGSYEEMPNYLTASSEQEINSFDWDFAERYSDIYEALSVTIEDITYEARDFEEEDINLEELEEISYPVTVDMETAAGSLSYETEVELEKIVDEEEDTEEWQTTWQPQHLMAGLEEPDEQVAIEREEPVRGEIFDRTGEPLAVNGEIARVAVVPEAAEDTEEAAAEVASVLDLNEEQTIEAASAYPDNPDWAAPVQDLPTGDERIDELLEISGVSVSTVEGREYPYGEVSGALIGYIGAMTAEELEEVDEGYSSTSALGKSGVELIKEEELRGTTGVEIAIQNEAGETRRIVQSVEAEAGTDVTLTIDIDMQQEMAEIIGEDSGTGVVMNPQNGETLVLASEPSVDSNLRYLGLPDPRAEELETPEILTERRFQRAYSPGSVWKPFTAVAGLEAGTLDPEEALDIDGARWQPDDSWGGYQVTRVNEDVDSVDLEAAMSYSDNIYFARQALALGADEMKSWGERFGMEDTFPFDFPLHASQLANEGFDNEILLADSGYGQGEVELPPVHLNALYSMFIREGEVAQPMLFEDSEKTSSGVTDSETAGLVRETLINVVEDENGTAHRPDPGHGRSLAGKTGTAELKSDQTVEDGEQIGWYTSFDYEQEDYVTTMMIQNVEEYGGSGYVVDLANEFWETLDE